MMEDKMIFAVVVILCATGLQIGSWIMGFNGTVFAFTSLLIGAIAGSILGFSINKKG